MTTKEMIQAEIDRLSEESLDELYRLIKRFAAAKQAKSSGGILSRLRDVKLEGPADFAANFDLYVSGERRVEDHLH